MKRTGIWTGVEATAEEIRLLTDYATETRSPGDYEPVSHEEAADAIDLADRIRAAVRAELPDTLI